MIFLFKYVIVPLHIWLYETTKGKIGSSIAGVPCLILYVTGRKSGTDYKVPLAYHPYGDEYVVVASNNGMDRHPGWYFNVLADDGASVLVGASHEMIATREIADDEYSEVWQAAIKTNPAWAGYREKTDRVIPLIALRPTR